MDIDLPYYLFWASVISGVIWAVDTWFFKPSRLAKTDSSGGRCGTGSGGIRAVLLPNLRGGFFTA